MKNIFILLVLVAAGYLLVTQTSAGHRLMSLMPNAQFEQLSHRLTQKIENTLTQQLPELIDGVKAELIQVIDDKLAKDKQPHLFSVTKVDEFASNESEAPESSAVEPGALVHNQDNSIDVNQEELEALLTKVALLTEQVNQLTKANALQASQLNAFSEKNTLQKQEQPLANPHIDNVETYSPSESHVVAKQKLMLQKIKAQMNQQTLALLAQ